MVGIGTLLLSGMGFLGSPGPGLVLTQGTTEEETIVAAIAVGGGVLIAIVAIVTGRMKSIMETRAKEQTRREVAAYVAEGSMTPEDGERLLVAGVVEGQG